MAAVATLSVDYGDGTSGSARFPLVQGAGFVTALYDNLTPILQSDHPLYSWSKIELDKDELSDFENPTVKYKVFTSYNLS